jgi:Phosphotyrosyl phosphate activator (PTPA) protein
LCLYKLHLLTNEDLTALVLVAFTAYIRTMRRLQEDYMLEPAGSHGVWGLDDYHCLPFLWGAAQLVGHPTIVPSSIHDDRVLQEGATEYLYLEAIQFIKKVKSSAPFEETSPMLNDISGMGDWAKVYSGLGRLFQGEVLNKMPVAQHLLFGSLIQHSWVTMGEDRKVSPLSSCGFASGQATKMPPTITAVRPVAGATTLLPGLDATTVFAGHPHPHTPPITPPPGSPSMGSATKKSPVGSPKGANNKSASSSSHGGSSSQSPSGTKPNSTTH